MSKRSAGDDGRTGMAGETGKDAKAGRTGKTTGPGDNSQRDLEEMKRVSSNIARILGSKTFPSGKPEFDEILKSPVDYFIRVADRVKCEYSVALVEFAALSYCTRAVAESYSGAVGRDIMAFVNNKIVVLQTMNDISRTIRRLRADEINEFGDIMKIFAESFPAAPSQDGNTVPDSLHKLLTDSIGRMKSEPEKVAQAAHELTDILVDVQLVFGIVLKWSVVAEREFLGQAGDGIKKTDWSRFYNEYVPPMLEHLDTIGRSVRTPPV